jgi:hypothetical protein
MITKLSHPLFYTCGLSVLTLIIGIVGGISWNAENIKINSHKVILIEKSSEALANQVVLTEIRNGRLSNAIELLEFSLDCSVVYISSSKNQNVDDREHIVRCLKVIKEYRQKYPRQEGIISGIDHADTMEISKKAASIIKDVH